MTLTPDRAPIAARPHRQTIFGIGVDNLTLDETVVEIVRLARSGSGHSVVTTNLDHALKLQDNPAFRDAYEQASLVTADGAPFVLMSALDRRKMKQRVAGSDLIGPICAAAVRENLSVFFLGSSLTRLARAASALTAQYPGLKIAGVYAPPFGFDQDMDAQAEARQWLGATQPDIVMVALGAPKQEIWSASACREVGHGVFLNIGAGLDFLSGEIARAPGIMQKTGTEWLYRALSEPARLGPRYLNIIAKLPALVRRHYATKQR